MFKSYYKKNIFVTIATSCAGIFNIILNAIYIPKYGFVVAGYTTAISYFILSLAHYIFMKKIQPAEIYISKYIFIISFIVVFSVLIIIFLYNYFWVR